MDPLAPTNSTTAGRVFGTYIRTDVHLYTNESKFTHMPIGIDEFESRDSESRETNAERVLRYLLRNRTRAYRAKEIAQATGISENSIHPVLNRLENRGLVRHRQPYWAIGDPEDVRDAHLFRDTAVFLDDTLGAESREEWLTAAREDEESHE